jgi:hypothetical protein
MIVSSFGRSSICHPFRGDHGKPRIRSRQELFVDPADVEVLVATRDREEPELAGCSRLWRSGWTRLR